MAPAKSCVCFGELLLRLSTPGEDLFLDTTGFEARIGGAEANVAVALSHFGHAARMVSRLPANRLGDRALAELRRHGVDTGSIEQVPGRMGLYFIESGAMLRSSQVIYDRQDSAFAAAEPDSWNWRRPLAGAAWLHLSGITPALGAGPAQACLDAARAAVKAGVAVSFDGNYREQLWALRRHRGKGVLHDLLKTAALAFVTDRDLALVLDQQFEGDTAEQRMAAATAQAFREFPRLQRIACTLRGEAQYAGLLFTRTRTLRSRSHSLAAAVDRVGSGDAFAAGILHGVMSRWSDQRALEFGAAAGALKHSVRGDFLPVGAGEVAHLVSGGSIDIRR